MNIRQLRYFLAVAKTLHFGRAAKLLNMAQPPLSTQIKQLEKGLGVLLFERTKRRVSLTEAGKVLQEEAQQVLARLDLAMRKTQLTARGEAGQLSVAFVSSAMYSILPPWLKIFRQEYPAVQLAFQEATSVEQIEGLKSHRLDVGFVRSPVDDIAIAKQTVWREPLLIALPIGHPLSIHPRISIASLMNESFILINRPLATEMYDQIIDFCATANFIPRISQTAEQLQTILGLVAAHIGIAILPAAAQKLQREGVCYRPFYELAPAIELMMIWRQDDSSAILKNFLETRPTESEE